MANPYATYNGGREDIGQFVAFTPKLMIQGVDLLNAKRHISIRPQELACHTT